jgi:NAD(P)-dependent dehydrogenase (short-subunit alcohol dehydrogenase family)
VRAADTCALRAPSIPARSDTFGALSRREGDRADGAGGLRVSDLTGQVALVTGAANGIGAATALRLATAGAHVVVADVETVRGRDVAAQVGGTFVRCDVRRPEDHAKAVHAAEDTYGGLDVAVLNAGVVSGTDVLGELDLDRYRRVFGVNVDGVVLGVHAVVPAMRRRGGGRIVATASLAGVAPVPMDPLYAASKHAVVGFVRSLGPVLAQERIALQALCPSYAASRIIAPIEGALADAGMPLLGVDEVADAVLAVLATPGAGECWTVVPGRAVEPFRFRGVPGPRPGAITLPERLPPAGTGGADVPGR